MRLNSLIVDEDPRVINELSGHLKSLSIIGNVYCCSELKEAIEILVLNNIDIVFFDVGLYGVSKLKLIRNLDNKIHVVVITSYREYAADAYELDVVDYIIKPIKLDRLLLTASKINRLIPNKQKEKYTEKMSNHFFVRVNKKQVKIIFDEILYVESLKDYINIKTINCYYIIHANLLTIIKLLPDSHFIRIHRSYIIAIEKVDAIEGNCVQIRDKLFPIGRNYIKQVKARILKGNPIAQE